MPSETDKLHEEIKKTIAALTASQADALARQLSVTFVLGYRKSGTREEISDLQRNAIKNLSREQLGYIAEFNQALGKQLEGRVKDLIAEGKGYADIRREMVPYIQEIFGPDGAVTIDRTGQTRQIIQVLSDGSLQRVEKTITQPYSASLNTYSDMLSRTATHAAYEHGRAEGYKASGFRKWRFVGPNDERARSWHVALLGNVYEYDTPESDMALEVLSEPNCRHRAIVFFEDPKLDTPQKFFEKQKEEARLKFENGEWTFAE